ncbi:CHAP domain-containing protein [Paraburkholderia bannensis]|uniref:CHAP domain-containing protein n=1 Tax=Paraburkholderia bannensis TaxID=765414 RepID=UPI002AB6AA4F|nr:CHAP domain-containing protein [Paraburkholderia bannensis]
MAYNGASAAAYAFNHAQPASTGHCAKYVRHAIQFGGVVVASTELAKNYGPNLLAAGFYEVTGAPVKGDVAVIQAISGHPAGHMAIFNGNIWISDFRQTHPGPNGFYPGQAYRTAHPPYKIYRHD